MQNNQLARNPRAIAAVVGSLAISLGGAGCATSSNSRATDQGQDVIRAQDPGTAEGGAEGSTEAEALARREEAAARDAALRASLGPELSHMLDRVPAENVQIVIHERKPESPSSSNGNARETAVVRGSLVQPAVDQYAALGQFLRNLESSVQQNERPSVSAMSELAFWSAVRVGYIGSSPEQIADVTKLRSNAEFELDQWVSTSGHTGVSTTSLTRDGLLKVRHFTSSATPLTQEEIIPALREAHLSCMLLLEAVSTHGPKLWGQSIAETRVESAKLMALLVEDDLRAVLEGRPVDPAIAAADVGFGRAAQLLTQIIAVSDDPREILAVSLDPRVQSLRTLSREDFVTMRGNGFSDANAFATYLAWSNSEASPQAASEWLFIRNLPEGVARGNESIPPVTASPEQEALLLEVLSRRGLFDLPKP